MQGTEKFACMNSDRGRDILRKFVVSGECTAFRVCCGTLGLRYPNLTAKPSHCSQTGPRGHEGAVRMA
jgi:hypothetical protein